MAPIKRHPNRHHKCHKNIDSQNTQTNSFTISFGFCYKIFRVQKANFQICLRHYPNRILSIIYNFFLSSSSSPAPTLHSRHDPTIIQIRDLGLSQTIVLVTVPLTRRLGLRKKYQQEYSSNIFK